MGFLTSLFSPSQQTQTNTNQATSGSSQGSNASQQQGGTSNFGGNTNLGQTSNFGGSSNTGQTSGFGGSGSQGTTGTVNTPTYGAYAGWGLDQNAGATDALGQYLSSGPGYQFGDLNGNITGAMDQASGVRNDFLAPAAGYARAASDPNSAAAFYSPAADKVLGQMREQHDFENEADKQKNNSRRTSSGALGNVTGAKGLEEYGREKAWAPTFANTAQNLWDTAAGRAVTGNLGTANALGSLGGQTSNAATSAANLGWQGQDYLNKQLNVPLMNLQGALQAYTAGTAGFSPLIGAGGGATAGTQAQTGTNYNTGTTANTGTQFNTGTSQNTGTNFNQGNNWNNQASQNQSQQQGTSQGQSNTNTQYNPSMWDIAQLIGGMGMQFMGGMGMGGGGGGDPMSGGRAHGGAVKAKGFAEGGAIVPFHEKVGHAFEAFQKMKAGGGVQGFSAGGGPDSGDAYWDGIQQQAETNQANQPSPMATFGKEMVKSSGLGGDKKRPDFSGIQKVNEGALAKSQADLQAFVAGMQQKPQGFAALGGAIQGYDEGGLVRNWDAIVTPEPDWDDVKARAIANQETRLGGYEPTSAPADDSLLSKFSGLFGGAQPRSAPAASAGPSDNIWTARRASDINPWARAGAGFLANSSLGKGIAENANSYLDKIHRDTVEQREATKLHADLTGQFQGQPTFEAQKAVGMVGGQRTVADRALDPNTEAAQIRIKGLEGLDSQLAKQLEGFNTQRMLTNRPGRSPQEVTEDMQRINSLEAQAHQNYARRYQEISKGKPPQARIRTDTDTGLTP